MTDTNKTNTDVKVDNKGRRTKIYIKLNQDETKGWQDIVKMISENGQGANEQELAKALFFRGVNQFLSDLREEADKVRAEMDKKSEDSKTGDRIQSAPKEESKLVLPESKIIVP
jgi:hypothetical protein